MYSMDMTMSDLGFPPASADCNQFGEFTTSKDEPVNISEFLQLPSDMESFMELGSIPEVTEDLSSLLEEAGLMSPASNFSDESLESTQSLIDEVEHYLQTVSGESTKVEGRVEGSDQADRIFRALTSGNVVQEAECMEELDLSNAYTTTVTGQDGENVIIIIAPPSPPTWEPSPSSWEPASPSYTMSPAYTMSPRSVLSPSPSSGFSYDTDADWSPSTACSPVSRAPRVRRKYERKVRAAPPSGHYPKEKKERKKAQNRSAAYKYREKKKAEQDKVGTELDQLIDRNIVLKKRLADMEIEVKCLKRLINEAGLGVV